MTARDRTGFVVGLVDPSAFVWSTAVDDLSIVPSPVARLYRSNDSWSDRFTTDLRTWSISSYLLPGGVKDTEPSGAHACVTFDNSVLEDIPSFIERILRLLI